MRGARKRLQVERLGVAAVGQVAGVEQVAGERNGRHAVDDARTHHPGHSRVEKRSCLRCCGGLRGWPCWARSALSRDGRRDRQPGTPEYVPRDTQNIVRRLRPPAGAGRPAATTRTTCRRWCSSEPSGLDQLLDQAATPNRLAITPGNVFPGWNVGNPLRRGWSGKRGHARAGLLHEPLRRADPRRRVRAAARARATPTPAPSCKPPYPGVVITTGSVQGSEHMYWWLAQDLAERGYVVLTYDVQGQGTSETLPHQGDQVNALPFCNPFARAAGRARCSAAPACPFQQEANFVYGTEDALDFFLSTPDAALPEPGGRATSTVNDYNPLLGAVRPQPGQAHRDARPHDPRRDRRPLARRVRGLVGAGRRLARRDGRRARQARRPATSALRTRASRRRCRRSAVQSEYGFTRRSRTGSTTARRSRRSPGRRPRRPTRRASSKTGFDAWRAAGRRLDADRAARLDAPRVHRHPVRAARRAATARTLTSVYVQAWLDRYLKHQRTAARCSRPRSGTSSRSARATGRR